MTPSVEVGSRECHCRGCGERFSALRTFDCHRIGDWPNRVCRSPVQMHKLGWLVNRHGAWIMSKMPDSALLARQEISTIGVKP